MWEIILAVYLSGLLMAMWKLWLPIHLEIRRTAKYSLVGKYPITMFITVFFMFAVAWPMVVWVCLNDDYADGFKHAFIDGAIKDDERG
tara:strand:+ start:454 stop:717 length:264 start_codon:yes stop_codon:yes gene_type:complete